MKNKNVNHRIGLYMILGMVCILIYYLPYLILGQESAFKILDFLDDEVVQYIYSGKYIWSSSGTIVEEWLSGVPLASVQPPCFTLILFFKYFSPYTAILLSGILGTVCAFLGMFLLCNQLLQGERKYISFMSAVLFCILPFYPLHGLSSVGIPLVIWSCLKIYDITTLHLESGKNIYLKCLPYVGICIFYAFSSSLVFAGYFIVGFMIIVAILLMIKKRKCGVVILANALLMTIVYCFTFRESVVNILFETYISHRSDPNKIYSSTEFLPKFIDMFKYGQYHVPSLHTYIMAFSLGVIFLSFLFYKKFDKTTKCQVVLNAAIWGGLLAIAAFHAFYYCENGLKFRAYLGPLESIQLDRIYWLNPTLWYVELALSVMIFFKTLETAITLLINRIEFIKIDKKKQEKFYHIFCISFVILFSVYFSNYIIHHINSAEYYSNIQRLFGKQTDSWTYAEFYDHELFDEIGEYIGKEKSEYRIGCVGFVPAIAQVNGFYTVDAYSTNYPLAYKYQFRQIIEKELEKSKELESYYDNWGSRCYLFSSELGTRFQIGKEEKVVLKDFEINTILLKNLGCSYIFSAVKIENADDNDMTLLDVFTTEKSKIEIYVYEI